MSYFRLGSYIRLLLLKKDFLKINNQKILDIGCNYGGITKILAANNRVAGIDPDEQALKIAQKTINQAKLIKASATSLPFKSQSFNTVVCLSVLEHVKNDQKVLAEISRVLNKNGRLYLTVPNQKAKLVPGWLEPIIIQINKLIRTDFPVNDHQLFHYGQEGIGHVHLGYSKQKITKMLKQAGMTMIDYQTYWHGPTRLAYLILMPLLRKKIIRPKLAKLVFLPFFWLDKIIKDDRGDILIKAYKI